VHDDFHRTHVDHDRRVGDLATDAAAWVLMLTPQQARRKASMASKHFWLRKLLQNFWRPT
jgi:hypothetical protein